MDTTTRNTKEKLPFFLQQHYRIESWDGTYKGNSVWTYKLGCVIARGLRKTQGNETIGVVDIRTGRFVSEVIR